MKAGKTMRQVQNQGAEQDALKAAWFASNGVGLFSLGAIIAYVLFIEWMWGWTKLWDNWHAIGGGPLFFAIGLMLATHFVRCLRIYHYFRADLSGRFLALFRVTQVHNLLTIMMPFRVGEASFFVLMKAQFSMPMTRSATSLVWMRTLDLHAVVAAGGLAVVAYTAFERFAIVLWLAYCVLPPTAFWLKKPLFAMAERYVPAQFQPLLFEVRSGLPGDWTEFLLAWVMTIVNWSIKISAIAWVLSLLGVVSVPATIGGALGGELSSVLPIHAPAGVGTYPAGITAGALFLGHDSSRQALATLAQAGVSAHILVLVSAAVGTGLSILLARKT